MDDWLECKIAQKVHLLLLIIACLWYVFVLFVGLLFINLFVGLFVYFNADVSVLLCMRGQKQILYCVGEKVRSQTNKA